MTDDLHDFLRDTRGHLDRELAASGAVPDLAASVARAREIDPSAVSAQAVQDVAELAPLAQLRPQAARGARVREDMSDRAALAPFTAALREQLDADLARQIHRGAVLSASGSGPAIAPIALASRRRPVLAVALALAAAVLLALGLGGALTARRGASGLIPSSAALLERAVQERREAERSATTALAPAPAPGGSATTLAESPVPEDSSSPLAESAVPEDSSAPPAESAVPQDSAAAEPPVPEDSKSIAADERPVEARVRPRRAAPGRPAAPAAPAEDPLVVLDREAQALWQAGDLRGAADKFGEIVRRAPGSRAAETAYGDLFALEHQLGRDPTGPWRAYLRQFPRGRYADDARAGICRREPADARPACWRDYLAAHPTGAHRSEAEQAATP